ncbi:MAG TPA: protein kinase [Anaerolineales bacterium]|nr:protein kinase [Anaerolineales bacterium]
MNTSKQKFKRYEIIEELGIGGMAAVYRAYDPLFEREVALKVLKRELLEDPEVRERFERETKIVAKLEHAAIVPVYDVGYDNDQLFYVMRYMSGGSLSERINEGRLDFEQISYILLRLVDALDYAHRKGIVHRDLKPGNILFDEVGNAFISDFGIAKFAQAATRITHSGIIGTPRYISPEQARGDDTDGRSDLYTLGVLFFEILSGKAPFEATTPLALAFKHATEPAPDILSFNPNLPRGLSGVLKKTLQKEPGDRYQTCTAFASAFLEALPTDTAPHTKFLTPPLPRTPQKHEGPAEVPHVPAPGTRTRPWIIGGFIVLALLGFAVRGYSQLTATTDASTSTPESVIASNIPPTPTPLPTASAAVTPTQTMETTVPVIPSIGGAINIALTSNREIFLMDMDGGNIKQLTNTNIPKFDLQWLPGGNELLYGEGKCVYKVNVEESQPEPEKIGCFANEHFDGFRVSPDGNHIAISIERRLIVLPFDPELLATAKTAFELQSSEKVCIDYTDVAVKGAQWSADGRSLAILYQSAVGERLGDTIRVIDVDLVRCKAVDPLVIDEFPGTRFTPEGYVSLPVLPSYHWDGDRRFVFNTFIRNGGYGELYLYDMFTTEATRLNPVNGVCCYRGAAFSPDGTYILVAFQDIGKGSESKTQLYYIPLDGSDAIVPLRLPLGFFMDIRENILLALRMPAFH